MTAEELAKREAELIRNENAWRNTKANIERDCLKIKAEIEQLMPKLTALRENVIGEETKLSELYKKQDELRRNNEAKEADSVKLDKLLEDRGREHETLETAIQAKKDNIESGLSDYRVKRRAEIEVSLESLGEETKQAEERLAETNLIYTNTVNRIDELKSKLKDIQTAIKDAAKQLNAQEALRDKHSEEIKSLEEAMVKLEKQIAQKRLESAEIDQKRADFEKYEKKAWAALNAMDKSLQGRLTDVERREQFAQNKQSFLPPR